MMIEFTCSENLGIGTKSQMCLRVLLFLRPSYAVLSTVFSTSISSDYIHCRHWPIMEYSVNLHFLSYEAAAQFCFEQQGELAQPLRESLNSCLAASISIIEKNGTKNGTNFWLGIKGDADMKQWWYVDSEDEISYSNWADVYAERKYDGCGVMLYNQTGHWGSEDCNKPHRFICQRSLCKQYL